MHTVHASNAKRIPKCTIVGHQTPGPQAHTISDHTRCIRATRLGDQTHLYLRHDLLNTFIRNPYTGDQVCTQVGAHFQAGTDKEGAGRCRR